MFNSQVKEFNNDLVCNNKHKIEINEYFGKYHANFNKSDDISFRDYFIELIAKKDEFIVPHSKLQDYGILDCSTSANVKKRLGDLGCSPGVDFLLFTGKQQDSKHGGSNKKEYMLTPKTFKKICISSGKTSKYSNYYLELEEIMYYFFVIRYDLFLNLY